MADWTPPQGRVPWLKKTPDPNQLLTLTPPGIHRRYHLCLKEARLSWGIQRRQT